MDRPQLRIDAVQKDSTQTVQGTGQDLTFGVVNESRQFEWRGTKLPVNRSWGASREQLKEWYDEGRILLKRIITASSDEGDMVLDPFCGCGTAVVAAHKLNRRWAGIDIIPFAIDLIVQKRLPEFKVPTEGYPYDLAGAAKLAREQPFKFEKWAVTRVPGLAPNDHQVGDGGIDGVGYLLAKPEKTTDQVLAQVKGGNTGWGIYGTS